MDPFDRWETEFAEDERSRIDRLLADQDRLAPEGSANTADWVNVPVKRWQRRWRRDR